MRRRLIRHWPVILASSLIAFAIVGVGVTFYIRARNVMEAQIRMQLTNMAAVASVAIDGDLLDTIHSPEDIYTLRYEQVARVLDALTDIEDVKFAYIFRQTGDPTMVEFVADVDTLKSFEELDENGNGLIDPEEDPGYPGELYDVTDVPALQGEAFEHPTADEEITYDQWGAFISGYAPIFRQSDGTVAGVVGLDMEADTFVELSQKIFSPGGLFLVFVGALLAAASAAVYAEARKIQMLHKVNEERSGLLRLTFHQIGEPLTIMKWSLETLREETEHPHLRKLVEDHITVMDEGLGRLNSIIDTLQQAEKVDLNTLTYLPVPTSLRALLENNVNEWQSSLKKRRQTITMDMPEEDIILPMDRALISLVLRQLLVNAIEYSPDNGEIVVQARQMHKWVEISVEDHGCGIPKADMEHLFEKYRRASNAHLKKPDGNGLGLYIAKGIVQKAGGQIHVESIEGVGTKVLFLLPLK